jgi:transcriptional antiterminator RfaH
MQGRKFFMASQPLLAVGEAFQERLQGLPELGLADAPNRKWCVLHTKSRREKKLATQCANLGVPCYLPLRKSITGRKGRRHISDVPLFPGYVFASIKQIDRRYLFQTGHIANVLDVADQEGLLDDLKNIQLVCEQQSALEPAFIVKRGQRVRIVDGPLAGIEGIVQAHKSRYRLILKIDCIQQAVACEIDIRMAVPI